MKFCSEDKDMLNFTLAQLKAMGIKVPKIKKIKTAVSKQNNKGPKQSNKIFGFCLADQERCNNSNPPKFILSCTEYLQNYLKEIGLFRKAGSISRQKKLRVKIESGGSLEGAEPNDVASLLKQWLRELPEPLVPSYLYDSFIRCQSLNDDNRTTAALLLCLLLPPEHLVTLKHLMNFLAHIATYKAINKMDFENLALIITPNIFVFSNNSIDKSSSLKVQQLTSIAELLIKNASQIGEIPQSLLFKFPIGEGKCESETNSLSESVESSPSLSRKHYLLRSIKRLVKQNGTVANSTATPESGHHFLRHTLSVSNMEKTSLKSISENKVSYNFFGSRNSEDVCKRSFRLLRKKDKRGLAPNQEFHPFTQSLEIERPLNYQVEIDHMKIFPPNKGTVGKSSPGGLFNYNSFDDNRPVLEDIEMVTFSIRLNEPSDHLVAFPIFTQSIQTNNFAAKQGNQYEKYVKVSALNTSKTDKNRGESINFSRETNVMKFTEVSKDILTCDSDYPVDNGDLSQSKGSATFTFPENSNNLSNQNISLFQNLMGDNSENDSMLSKTCTSKTQFLKADNDCSNKVLGKDFAENTDTYQLLRQNTFVIEPSQNKPSELIKRPYIDEKYSKRSNTENNLEGYRISSKRPCLNISTKAKGHDKNESVKRITSKSVNTERTSVKKSKPSMKQTPIKKNRIETSSKGCSSLSIKEDIKVFYDQTPPSNVLHRTENLRSSSKRENELDTTHQTFASCVTKSTFSENTKTVPKDYSKNNLSHKRKLSFHKSSHSDSKIPRFRNSFEVSASNSFNEDMTARAQKPLKPKSFQASGLKSESSTRIPIKCNDSRNLSNLELSIDDSCFLTPRRNAMLSPNSIVWMSGRKYLDSMSPEVRAFNKRESIAMILKTNSGHVQAKVHLYDDLVRESVDTPPSKPSHSTPTSKLSRNSVSSQSMKATPKLRRNASSEKFTPKKLSVSRSKSLRHENELKSCQPKFILHTDAPSPIKSLSLKDVTNTSIGSKSSINLKFENEKTGSAVIGRKKLKRNSFSGNNSKKSVKRISRSESSPGCQRPSLKVTCLIQE